MSTSSTSSSTTTSWYDRLLFWRSSSTSTPDLTYSDTESDPRIQEITEFFHELNENPQITEEQQDRIFLLVKEVKEVGRVEQLKSALRAIGVSPAGEADEMKATIRYLLKDRCVDLSNGCCKICDTRFAHHIVKLVSADWHKALATAAFFSVGATAIYALAFGKKMESPKAILIGGSIGVGLTTFVGALLAGYKAFRNNP